MPRADAGNKRLAYAAAIAAVVLMGSLGMFVRNIAADPVIVAFVRFALGIVFLLGFFVVKRDFQPPSLFTSSPLIASGLSIGLCVWSYIEAIVHTSLANAAFLLYLGPLMAIGFAYLFLNEKLFLKNVLLISLALLGSLLVLRFDFSASLADVRGSIYGLLSALGYALFIVSNRKIPSEVSPLSRAFYQMLVATLTLAPFLAGRTVQTLWQDLPWLICVGFFQGFLALTLMIFAFRHLTACEYGLLSYLEPVTATLIGVTIYAEPLMPLQLLGGSLIVLSGVAQVLAGQTDRIETDRIS